MAKRIVPKSRRKARKPVEVETIEVDGHKVNAALWHQKRLKRASIIAKAVQQADSLALSDVLFAERVSTGVPDRVMPLFDRGHRASAMLGVLNRFPFHEQDKQVIALGNTVLTHCANEFEAVATELRSMQRGIEKELAAEVPHGG